MCKDTGESTFRRIRGDTEAKKKGRVFTRPVETSARQQVSYNYFGWVAGAFGAVVAGLGAVVAGLVGDAAGFDPAGLAAGAGTPDCAL